MDTYKIWYIGRDEKLLSTLEKNVPASGISITHFDDDGTLQEISPKSWPDILIVDLAVERAVSLLADEQIQDAALNHGMVTAFIARTRPSNDSLTALAAGFDLCWDIHNNDRNLLRALLQREVSKKKESGNGFGKPGESISPDMRVYNETVAALADGAVELLKLKEDVEKRNTELMLVRDELEQFVHSVSHDLKAPLLAVRTFTTILMEEILGSSEDADGNLNRIRESVDLMTRQIDSLLAFSRAGRVNEDAEVEDIQGLINGVTRSHGYDGRDDVNVNVTTPLPPIRGAEQQVKQIFNNLISNGVKHNKSARKVVEVSVTTELQEEIASSFNDGEIPPGFVLFRVSDNGYGIPGEDHNAPFELFRRLVDEDFTEGDGAGLAIVKRAVTSLGGSIDYVSSPGEGTVMYFTLPIARKSQASAKQKAPETTRSVEQLKEALMK